MSIVQTFKTVHIAYKFGISNRHRYSMKRDRNISYIFIGVGVRLNILQSLNITRLI